MDSRPFAARGRRTSATMRAATAGLGIVLIAAGTALVVEGLRGVNRMPMRRDRHFPRAASVRSAARHVPGHITTLEAQGRWVDESWLERHPASAIPQDVALPDRPGPMP